MFRLKATLVATTLMRPWRTGWSPDRGVDFSVSVAKTPLTVPTVWRGDQVPAEPACFLNDDWAMPAGTTVVRPGVSAAPAETASEAASKEMPEAPGLRAWWRVASGQ